MLHNTRAEAAEVAPLTIEGGVTGTEAAPAAAVQTAVQVSAVPSPAHKTTWKRLLTADGCELRIPERTIPRLVLNDAAWRYSRIWCGHSPCKTQFAAQINATAHPAGSRWFRCRVHTLQYTLSVCISQRHMHW